MYDPELIDSSNTVDVALSFALAYGEGCGGFVDDGEYSLVGTYLVGIGAWGTVDDVETDL